MRLWIAIGLLGVTLILGLVWSTREVDRICRDRNTQLGAVQTLLQGLAKADAARPDIDRVAQQRRLELFNEAFLALAPVEC